MNTTKPNGIVSNNKNALKRRFILALEIVDRGESDLKKAVTALLKLEVTPTEMVQWAVEEKFSESWARTVISRVMVEAGQRRRKTGGGRKTPAMALELASVALEMLGDEKLAASMLLAAYRVLRTNKLKAAKHPHLKIFRNGVDRLKAA